MAKQIWLGILSYFLLIPMAQAQANPAVDAALRTDAQAHQQFAVGRYRSAIGLWEEALVTFKKEKYERGITAATVQIAQSQRAIGYPIQACKTLQELLDANPYLCQPDKDLKTNELPQLPSTENHVIAAITLGNLLREFGLFEPSQTYLNLALDKAKTFKNQRLTAGARMGLGNLILVQLLLEKDRLAYQQREQIPNDEIQRIKASFKKAYEHYEFVFDTSLERDARLKWAILHEEHRKWLSLLISNSFYRAKNASYAEILSQLKEHGLTEASPVEISQFNLELAELLFEFAIAEKDSEVYLESLSFAQKSISIAKQMKNDLLLSKGYGHIGKMYRYSGQDNAALKSFNLASKYAYVIDRSAPLYEWQYEIAKILTQQGDLARAATFFESAIQSIQEIKWDISPLKPTIRINFQEKIRPVFDDYVALLLAQKNPTFKKILQVRDSINLSELENYLGCGTLTAIASDQLLEQDEKAIIINIFKSGGNYHTIVQRPEGFLYSKVDQAKVNPTIDVIEAILNEKRSPSTSQKFLTQNFKDLYQLFINPIEQAINPNATLLFSLDPRLQNIPMGMLVDKSSTFLIEKHPVALIGQKLYQPTRLSFDKKTKIFFAGISSPNTEKFKDFPELPYVSTEADVIQATTQIIDKKFTKERFLAELIKPAPIVHIATHGEFSSKPGKTFILAWNEKITLLSLADVVGKRAQNTPTPIELLVLSACETAKGDRLAVLGMAGLTIQAGARSTLASLWRSEDESSARLMEDFYKHLNNGKSKAKALQLAQLKLIEEGRNFYSWGNFVLVGSWL